MISRVEILNAAVFSKIPQQIGSSGSFWTAMEHWVSQHELYKEAGTSFSWQEGSFTNPEKNEV
jgi:hypothetical protein